MLLSLKALGLNISPLYYPFQLYHALLLILLLVGLWTLDFGLLWWRHEQPYPHLGGAGDIQINFEVMKSCDSQQVHRHVPL